MDIKTAAAKTKELINGAWILPATDPEYGKNHLHEMADKIISGEITDEKAHRWLGWMQGCICAGGGATLQTLKEINHAA